MLKDEIFLTRDSIDHDCYFNLKNTDSRRQTIKVFVKLSYWVMLSPRKLLLLNKYKKKEKDKKKKNTTSVKKRLKRKDFWHRDFFLTMDSLIKESFILLKSTDVFLLFNKRNVI